jgi:hypothetical protein
MAVVEAVGFDFGGERAPQILTAERKGRGGGRGWQSREPGSGRSSPPRLPLGHAFRRCGRDGGVGVSRLDGGVHRIAS